MANKFTQEEFDNHYKEFIMNPSKYQSMDLNFKMSMLMRGCSNDEFDSKIDNRGASAPKSYEQGNDEWVDRDENEYDSSIGGGKLKRRGGEYNDVGDDSNEY